MPLRKGSTKSVIRSNIKELIKDARLAGKPITTKKAVAIAMNKAGKKKLTKSDIRKKGALSLRNKLSKA